MRLIDADALLAHQFKNDISYNAFRSLVKRQATIDAVPVVRCKDCKHGDKENGQYYCHYTGETWNDGNFYCAGGERKDDD